MHYLLAEVVYLGSKGDGLEGLLTGELLPLLYLFVVVVEVLEHIGLLLRSAQKTLLCGRRGCAHSVYACVVLQLGVERVGDAYLFLHCCGIFAVKLVAVGIFGFGQVGECEISLLVHLILDCVADDGDEDGGEVLLGAEFGGLDVGVRLLRDEDGGDLAVAEVQVVVERERRLLAHPLLILNYILSPNHQSHPITQINRRTGLMITHNRISLSFLVNIRRQLPLYKSLSKY